MTNHDVTESQENKCNVKYLIAGGVVASVAVSAVVVGSVLWITDAGNGGGSQNGDGATAE